MAYKKDMLIYLFIISLLTRAVFLFFGYPSITHDEADYFVNSYLLSRTGSDIFSQKFFLTSGILNSTSGVLVYIGSIIFMFFGKSIVTSRLPYAVIDSFIPVLLYLIVEKLTKNKRLAFLSFTVMNFSPWFSYLSSMSAFDSPISLFLYLLAFYILLTNFKKTVKYALYVFFAFLSFNSYMGIKTSFVFLALLAQLVSYFHENKNFKVSDILKNVLLSVSMFAVFFGAAYYLPSASFFRSRLKEKIVIFDAGNIEKNVVYNRYLSAGPNPLIKLFHNKVTYLATTMGEKYFFSFNPVYIFVKGDPNPLYGNNFIGQFFFTDSLFLLIGLFAAFVAFSKKKLPVYTFLFMFLIVPIQNAVMVDSPNIAVRAMPLIIPYSFFIALGIYVFTERFIKNRRLRFIIPFAYGLSIFMIFFTLFQVTIKTASSEQWHYPEKQLIEKIYGMKNKYKKVYVYSTEPRETMLLLDFYKIKDGNVIKKSLVPIKGEYLAGNIVFKNGCPKGDLDPNNLYIIKRYACDLDKIWKELNTPIKSDPFLNSTNKSGTIYWHVIPVKEKI